MKTTYLKCHHGNEIRFGCRDCQQEKQLFFEGIVNHTLGEPKETKIPIYRGCNNKVCFCTGTCKEIIGYREL